MTDEKNIRLILEYKGTAYAGWQSQDGPATVQDEVIAAIRKTTGQSVTVTGAGRTDAGVHALGQVANFRIRHDIAPEKYREALNHYLPDDIRVHEATEVPAAFDARRSARWKRYRYLLADERSALYRDYRWEVPYRLDGERMREAAALITGAHDFSAFCVVASRKEDNRCTIYHSQWRRTGPLWVYEIRGNRFLHTMVRCLVGGMVNLARCAPDQNQHNLTLDRFADILIKPGADRVTFTAPPQGLYLVSVHYDED